MCLIFTRNVSRIYLLLSWKVQKYYLWNPGTSLEKRQKTSWKIQKVKKKKKKANVGFDPTISCLDTERSNYCTLRDLFQAGQKDNIHVDSGLYDYR